MENKKLKIAMAGASGVGKTTLAKSVWSNSTKDGDIIYFSSGSVSELIPETKDMTHSQMLSREVNELQSEDYQILTLRSKIFRGEEDNIISDRSFLDSAGYFIYKQADKLQACEIEHFLLLCERLTTELCTHLIFIDFTENMLSNWITEDNKKRITSNYFQMEISSIMRMVLNIWLNKSSHKNIRKITSLSRGLLSPMKYLKDGAERCTINNLYGSTEVLIIRECNKEVREELVWDFINGKI